MRFFLNRNIKYRLSYQRRGQPRFWMYDRDIEKVWDNAGLCAYAVSACNDFGKPAVFSAYLHIVKPAHNKQVFVVDSDAGDLISPGPGGGKRLKVGKHKLRPERLQSLPECAVELKTGGISRDVLPGCPNVKDFAMFLGE
jgi:hypothetical protein